MITRRVAVYAARHQGFAARVGAMLDEIVRLNAVDPSFTCVLQTLIEDAVAADELSSADLEIVLGTLRAMAEGLMVTGKLSSEGQARAVEGLKRLLSGTLLRR